MKNHLLQTVVWIILTVLHSAYGQWVPTGGPNGGQITAITLSGSNIFAGTYGNGMYLSTNNGANWVEVNSGITDLRILCLAAENSRVVAGTPHGIFQSTDNGKTWNTSNSGLLNNDVCSIISVDSSLFVGTGNGIYRSVNGSNWTYSGSGLPSGDNVFCLAYSNKTLIAGIRGGDAIYFSIDNGANWTAATISSRTSECYCFAVYGNKVLASTFDGIYLSIDNGKNWVEANYGLPTRPFIYAIVKCGSTLLASSEFGIYRSVDSGAHWTADNSGTFTKHISSSIEKGTDIFAGTNDGVFHSVDNGTNWISSSSGITVTDIASLTTTNKSLFAGVGRTKGSLCISKDYGVSWAELNNDLPADFVISSMTTKESDIFIGTDSGVYRSSNNGDNWTSASSGFPSDNTFITSLAVCGPALFAGTYTGVYRSMDNGQSWYGILYNSELSRVWSFALCDSEIFVSLASKGIFLSNDNGNHWIPVNSGLQEGGRDVRTLSVCGSSLFVGTSYGLYRSDNHGALWERTKLDVPDLTNITSVVQYRTSLFASTEGSGVFLSMDNGANWAACNIGLHPKSITSLAIIDSTLFAGTYYFGVWKLNLSAVDISIHPENDDNRHCGCGAGTGLAIIPPVWFKWRAARKRVK